MSTLERIKFVVLNGSPKRDGHTASLVVRLMEAVEPYADCERIDLYEEMIPPVSGELDVPLGEPTPVQQKLLACDAFVLVTPTYWFNMPGVVKNFIDHLTVLEDNDFMLEGKVAGCIVYTPEGGGENILQNLAMVFNHMGIVVPPYCLVFDRGDKTQWVRDEIPLMVHSLCQQVNAQKNNSFHWNYEALD
jgi:multimeric flavodoxin WrbA